MLHGDVLKGGWKDEHVKEALDLCLACKGCKGDCPVNVDMATYKAEFLSHYYEGRLRPRSAYAMGLVQFWAHLGGRIPGLANLFTQTRGLDALAKWAAGVHPERQIPEFAKRPLQRLARDHARPRSGLPQVILFPDTFNNFFHPEVGLSGLSVLSAAGFEAVVPQGFVCCGRPLYDYGMLDTARRLLQRMLKRFAPEIEDGVPFVVLEPSCAAVFKDELKGLFPHDPNAKRLSEQTFVLSQFLEQRAPNFQLPRLDAKVFAHGHCHHKAIFGFDDEKKVLTKMGVELEAPDTGCCGMAGSFGFEKSHYDVSQKVGELVLLPKVRALPAETVVLADGFSCQEQVLQGTQRRPLHRAQLIEMGLENRAPEGPLPERDHPYAERPSLKRVKLALAGVGLAAFALLGWTLAPPGLARRVPLTL
jgi:Fe-S oxidoreductase